METLRVVLPTGLGDCHWAMQKLRGLKEHVGAKTLIVEVAENIHQVSWKFAKLVPFVDVARPTNSLQSIGELRPGYQDERWSTLEGSRGFQGYDFVLCPNGHLEAGRRIEEFFPEVSTDFSYPLNFESVCAYPGAVVLYPSGVGPNNAFHSNWWTQHHWRQVIRGLADRGIKPVIVGNNTKQDRDYATPMLQGVEDLVTNLVGQTSTDEVLHLISKARFYTGLASGLGILSAMMGTPTAIHWPIKPFGKFHPKMPYCWLEAKQLERYRVFAYGDPGFTPAALLQAFDDLS